MSHVCTGCNVGYPSLKGLERHENQCTLKMVQQTVPDNALEIYRKKKERKRQEALELKRHKNMSDNLPLPELPHVRQFPYLGFPIITVLHSLLNPPGMKPTWKLTRSRPSFLL